MENNKVEFYENKINRMKAYYLEEIRERDNKLAVIHILLIFFNNKFDSKFLSKFQNLNFKGDVTNVEENAKNKSVMEHYEFRIGELQLQKEELLTQFNVN